MNYAVYVSQIADRLPFTGDTLVSSKIGKIVRKLAKDAPISGEYSLLFRAYVRCGIKPFLGFMYGLPYMHQS
jgi:hypothetical protein